MMPNSALNWSMSAARVVVSDAPGGVLCCMCSQKWSASTSKLCAWMPLVSACNSHSAVSSEWPARSQPWKRIMATLLILSSDSSFLRTIDLIEEESGEPRSKQERKSVSTVLLSSWKVTRPDEDAQLCSPTEFTRLKSDSISCSLETRSEDRTWNLDCIVVTVALFFNDTSYL